MNKEERRQLNRDFLSFHLQSSIPSMKWGLIVNLLLFVVFAAINELCFPEIQELKFFMRFGIVIPFLAMSILALQVRNIHRWLSPLFIAINILLCVTIFLVGYFSDPGEPGYAYYFAWVILMVIGLYTFYRLRFSVLLLLGILQLVAYILANLFNRSFQNNFFMALNDLFFIIGAAVLGFFIAYTFQHLNKKNFLHQKALESQYKRLLAEFTEKEKMEEKLIRASEQKMIMLKEIHHRVKNNLAIVISMLSLQMRYAENPALKRVISDVEMRIRSMALIHEHLYRSEDLDRIRLHEYLNALTTILLNSFSASEINLDTAFEPMDVSIETALPVGLITNELMTNAIKYAFPDHRPGTIRVNLQKSGDRVHLIIADDGIGLPDDFRVDSDNTLGIFIVRLLVEQIGAELTFERNHGATFHMTFPVSSIRKPFTK